MQQVNLPNVLRVDFIVIVGIEQMLHPVHLLIAPLKNYMLRDESL